MIDVLIVDQLGCLIIAKCEVSSCFVFFRVCEVHRFICILTF